jgi:hypothetical protein
MGLKTSRYSPFPVRTRRNFFVITFRSYLKPTQLHIQVIINHNKPRLSRPEHEADHELPCNTEAKN